MKKLILEIHSMNNTNDFISLAGYEGLYEINRSAPLDRKNGCLQIELEDNTE